MKNYEQIKKHRCACMGKAVSNQEGATNSDRSVAISVHCIPKAVYTVKKCSRGWASLSPETCRADLKRSINGICCIFLVAYVVILTMHGITNIEYIGVFIAAWTSFGPTEPLSGKHTYTNFNILLTVRLNIFIY